MLSAFFLGVFAAPLLSLLWFAVPWLRYFPVGDDSPHAIALPLGFLAGIVLATQLNKSKRWWIAAIVIGVPLILVSGYYFATAIDKMQRTDGWDGFGALFECVILLHGVVSAVGLLLSGVFSMLGWRIKRIVAADAGLNKTAEQDGARQPATRPESESE